MIRKIDHLVITAADAAASLAFYQKLGFDVKEAGDRYELYAGDFKINLHFLGQELSPHAQNIRTGSADFCFEIEGDLVDFKQELERNGLKIELGIVVRNGVRGAMHSIYLRDPDGNLVEFCRYE